jgi:hypothetical protein
MNGVHNHLQAGHKDDPLSCCLIVSFIIIKLGMLWWTLETKELLVVIPIYTYFIWILVGLSLVPTLELVLMVSYLLQIIQYNSMNKVFNCVLVTQLTIVVKDF